MGSEHKGLICVGGERPIDPSNEFSLQFCAYTKYRLFRTRQLLTSSQFTELVRHSLHKNCLIIMTFFTYKNSVFTYKNSVCRVVIWNWEYFLRNNFTNLLLYYPVKVNLSFWLWLRKGPWCIAYNFRFRWFRWFQTVHTFGVNTSGV